MYVYEHFEKALILLNGRLGLNEAPKVNLVVCGGTALVATELVDRVTRDVDIVALANEEKELIDPAPLPGYLIQAANEVAENLELPNDWLNNGPSSGEGGLFRLGLPEGFSSRIIWGNFGEKLSVGFISRIDQIHFKFYAAVDQAGSYHATDLQALDPTDEELLDAVRWTQTHDPSEGYLESMKWFLREFGYEQLVERV